jgi:hypothetical protein
MKRFLIMFAVLGLVAASMATAEAKKPRKRVERTVEGTYDTQFVPFGGLVTHTCAKKDAKGCVIIDTRANEAYFTARAVDAHGQPVLVTVTGWSPDAGPGRTYGTFCGETEEPIAFDRGEKLRFSLGYWDQGLPTNWASCPPGFGTTGMISVTLSNVP